MLNFLYHTALGRFFLKGLTSPVVSQIVGKYMDSPLSIPVINKFIKANDIDMSEYVSEKYHCFNDFFCRRIEPSLRPIDQNPNALIAPSDGLLSGYHIKKDLVIPVKGSRYSISDLLRDKKLAKKYEDGICLVFRLCVNHYHRYCYIDSGTKSENIFLPGILHTVQPIALREVPVFTENSREYTILSTENFGDVIHMEVGAMLVGKIDNYHSVGRIRRGAEKGRFLYGGSTIILLLEKDKAKLTEKLFAATDKGLEVPVKMGQKIGYRK